MTPLKILITGSSGVVGTRLSQKLLEAGHLVTGIDMVQNRWDEAVAERTLLVDLRDTDALWREAPKDIDLVIHLAANARVYDLVQSPELARDNLTTTAHVLDFVRTRGIRRLIFASSREIYGDLKKDAFVETDFSLESCENPYTASKVGGEALITAYHKCFGIDYVTFRFSNIYGMYDISNRVIPLFIRLCATQERLRVYGKDKLLDFIYIDDVIDGIMKGIDAFDSIKNTAYNLASGEGTSLLHIAELIQREMGSTNDVLVEENRAGEVMRCIANIDKARTTFGFEPKTPIGDGITKTVRWYRDHAL